MKSGDDEEVSESGSAEDGIEEVAGDNFKRPGRQSTNIPAAETCVEVLDLNQLVTRIMPEEGVSTGINLWTKLLLWRRIATEPPVARS